MTTADVFGIYQEGVQQHLDDAFANKAHPGDSPQFPVASGPFTNTKQPPSTAAPAVAALAAAATSTSQPAATTDQQPTAQSDLADQHSAAETQPADATAGTAAAEAAAAVATAEPAVQDAAAPAAAAAPSADHTAAELPAGAAHDAAALTAASGIPTAIVPSDGDAVVEGAPTASAGKADQDAAPTGVMPVQLCAVKILVDCQVQCNSVLMSRHLILGGGWVIQTAEPVYKQAKFKNSCNVVFLAGSWNTGALT